jgi:transposase
MWKARRRSGTPAPSSLRSYGVGEKGQVGARDSHRARQPIRPQTQAVEQFLALNPKVRLHFTPTYSSWLNQVEIWFAKIERDVIARGVFTSVADLRRKLMKYIRAYAHRARPIRWKYTDPRRRITAKRIAGTVH